MRLGAIALIFSASLAQAGPDGPSPGPGTPWQLPDAALGVRITPILLLSRPDVQLELTMRADQAEAALAAIDDLYTRAASLRGRTGADAVAARRAIDEAAGRWIEEHLDDAQRSRLGQIELQWEGASALVHRPTVAASLGLDDEQRRRIGEVVARPPRPGEGPIDRHRRHHRDAASALTDEQRLRWLAMLGPPFEPGATTAARGPAPSTLR